MHRDHERLGGEEPAAEDAPRGVARRHGVVGVDELEGELPPEPSHGSGEHGRRPCSPRGIRPVARRRDVGHVRDAQAVHCLLERLADEGGHRTCRAGGAGRQGGSRGDEAVQDQDTDLGAGLAGRERLAVRPDSEHRVPAARVELG